MPHKQKNLFSLARGKVRASWNSQNLYNLYKKNDFMRNEKTLFQQKWASKRELRAYHGEHIREGTLIQQIPKKLQGVVLPLGNDVTSEGIMSVANMRNNPMVDYDDQGKAKLKTPFAMQTFVHLEKRLDFALFRAMFASSVRQAGQFIRQGNVTVNGVKVKHAYYPLQPGDLFAVNPEKVLFAAGKAKPSVEEAVKIDNRQIKKFNQYIKKCNDDPDKMWQVREGKREKRNQAKNMDPKKQVEIQTLNEQAYQDLLKRMRNLVAAEKFEDLIIRRETFIETLSEESKDIAKKILKLIDQQYPANGAAPVAATTEGFITPESIVEHYNVVDQAAIEAESAKIEKAPDGVSAEEFVPSKESQKAAETVEANASRIEYRNRFMSEIGSTKFDYNIHPKDVNHVAGIQDPAIKSLVANMLIHRKAELSSIEERKTAFAVRLLLQDLMVHITSQLHQSYEDNQEQLVNGTTKSGEINPLWLQQLGPLREKIDAAEAAENEADVKPDLPWQKDWLYGRKDTSKPYFTPWRFRPFISPSVILPHHIEIDFTTCSAVYMRDPVARPGMSEVISPFALTNHELANLYYVKK